MFVIWYSLFKMLWSNCSESQSQEVSLPEVTWGKRKVRLMEELDIILSMEGGGEEGLSI